MPNDHLTTESWGLLEQSGPVERRQMLRRIAQWGARNGLMAFLDQAVVSGVNFLTALILARYLSAFSYGQYVLLFALVLFINSLQNALITSPLMVIAPRHDADHRKDYYSRLWVLQLVGCAIAAVVMLGILAVGQRWQPDLIAAVPLFPALLMTVTYLVQEFVRRALFARLSGLDGFLVDLISYGTQVVSLVALIASDALTLEGTLWAIGLTSLAGCLFGIIRLGLGVRNLSVGALQDTWRQHWDQGRWLTGSMMAQWVAAQFYFFVVAIILSPAAAGLLAASRNLLGFTHIFLYSLENFVPSVATQRLVDGGLPAMMRWLNRFRLALSIVVGIYCLAAAIFAEPLMGLLFGAEYQGTGTVVALLALSSFLLALNRSPIFGLRALEQSQWIFYAHLASSAMTLIISVPLVQAVGVAGAAGGLLLTQALLLSIAGIGYRRVVRRRDRAMDRAGATP